MTKITRRPDATTTLITMFTYDPANGNLLTTRDPLTHETTIGYNSFGQPTSVQGPIASEPPTSFHYDAVGNLDITTDPLGNQTQRAYDAVSRLVQLTDPWTFSTQFRADDLNRVTEIADARQGITRFHYDPNGNLLSVSDTKNQTTTYTYDNMDRLATRKDALNRTESYHYDPNGNLDLFTDRKNQPSTFTYNALNRRASASYADGSSTSFTYDSVGRLAAITDSISGAIQFVYDNLNRLSQEITPQGTVAYQYDAASRLTQVAKSSLVVGLHYDDAGRRDTLTYPNGTSTGYGYDDASRLQTITHNGPAGVIESLSYIYDAGGNRINLTRTNSTATQLPAAVQAAYDAANEQTQFAGVTLQYDPNGNLTNDGSNTYTWDARNRLIAISGGVSASFIYDALGRRTSKTVNGVTTSYQYDGNDIVTETGATTASYLRGLSIDEPFIRQSSSNEYYHTDALGSTLALSNTAGAAATSYNYEAFGRTTVAGSSTNPFQYTGRENDAPALYYYRARYYSPISQRFLSQDPIKVPRSLLSLELQNATLCSRNLQSTGPFILAAMFQRPQRSYTYLYVNNNPLGTGDPLGFGPSSECFLYLGECAKQGTGSYACSAILPCTGLPDDGVSSCIRNCLLEKYQQGCNSWGCQFTGGSTFGGAHGECFKGCLKCQRQ